PATRGSSPMANNKEEAGKGTPRPGEMPGSRRTFATLDLTAAEVEGRAGRAPTAAGASSTSTAVSAGTQATAHATSANKSQARSQERSQAGSGPVESETGGKPDDQPTGAAAASADPAAEGAPRAATSMAPRRLGVPWLTHLASGALGALVVLIVTE